MDNNKSIKLASPDTDAVGNSFFWAADILLIRETEKAVQVESKHGDREWLPKSQLKQSGQHFIIPTWLFSEKFANRSGYPRCEWTNDFGSVANWVVKG